MKLKKWRTCILAALSAALILSTNCALSVAGTESRNFGSQDGKDNPCFIVDNRSYTKAYVVLDILVKEKFQYEQLAMFELEGGKKETICSDELKLNGHYRLCYADNPFRQMNCLNFVIDKEHYHFLFDKEPDCILRPLKGGV